jgi:hypothetical protein
MEMYGTPLRGKKIPDPNRRGSGWVRGWANEHDAKRKNF